MEKVIDLFWQRKDGNFGDELSPYIVQKLSGKKVKFFNTPSPTKVGYMAVGSILHHLGIGMKWCEVWGSGLMSQNNKLTHPKKIHAVRGPLTRKFLMEQGIECPDIYGDPALLLPRLFNPKVKKKYRVGIVPHFVDQKDAWVELQSLKGEVLLINVYEPVEKVITDILSCQAILSSSLHGLIVADAYRIPSLWIRLSDKVKGGGFKFRDYLLSIGVDPYEPYHPPTASYHIDIPLKLVKNYDLKIDLNRLLENNPFKEKR
jgi:pyruvyltransferase